MLNRKDVEEELKRLMDKMDEKKQELAEIRSAIKALKLFIEKFIHEVTRK